jgi:putative glutamine amidotransferase
VGTDRRGAPPLIGMTGRRWPGSVLGARVAKAMHDAEVDLHFADYSVAVAAAGGMPVGLSRDAPVEPLLARLDGLVLSGGADVDPARYGAEREPGCGDVEPERDGWELALLRAALELGVPVLGVCRGVQVLNVALGGTLVQDVGRGVGDGHPRFDSPRDELAHDVKLVPGTLAAAVYAPACGTTFAVNSLHHQVVDEVGRGLVVGARSPDGAVEALELPGRAVFAVQWHPEMLRRNPDPGFRWLVEQSAAVAAPSRSLPN